MLDTNKKILFKETARKKIQEGVNILADAVGCTLGPRGNVVIIEQPGKAPWVTKDGVSVAKSINLKDQFQNLGVQMIKEVASRTVDVAGDGTTTATILARAIYNEGLKLLAANHKASEIKKGIDWGVGAVCEELDRISVPVNTRDQIVHVGTVSANGDANIGEMIANAMDEVGRSGVITVEEAKGYSTSLEVVEGMQIDRGFLSAYFVTNSEKMASELNEPYVLICNDRITAMEDIVPILQKVKAANKALLIMADDVEGEALQGLTVNKLKGILSVCAIRSPGFGDSRLDYLGDIAALTGGKIVSTLSGIKLKDAKLEDLGRCKRAIVGKGTTTLVGLSKFEDDVKERVEELNVQLKDPTMTPYDTNLLESRLGKLAGGVAILRVGGSTEVELKERKDRVDDALCATQAAVEAGITEGGGTALVRASHKLKPPGGSTESFKAGVEIVKKACQAPLRLIALNADYPPDIVVDTILKSKKRKGFNADTGEYVDMMMDGIIDPIKVPKTALMNAASVSGLMLTLDCAVAEEDPQYMDIPMGGPMGMPM